MNPFRSRPRAAANPMRRRLFALAWLTAWVVLGAAYADTSFGFSWRLFLLTVLVAGLLPIAAVAWLSWIARRGGAP